MVLGNDITTPVAITEFEKAGFTRVFDRDKISIVLDHYTPCKDIKSAELCLQARNFAHKHQITNFFDVGQMGVEHALLPEKGLCAPGEIIVGADSHTCTSVSYTHLDVYKRQFIYCSSVPPLTYSFFS